LNALATASVQAFRSLKEGFGKLEAYINESKPGPPPQEITVLIQDYRALMETSGRFERQREMLKASSLLK
jgi:hypothetical protein